MTRVKKTVDTHIPWWKEAGGLQLKTVSQGKTQGPRYVRSRKIQKESRHNENMELSEDGGCGEKREERSCPPF